MAFRAERAWAGWMGWMGWMAGYIACETLDMLKSGTRSAGVAVREK